MPSNDSADNYRDIFNAVNDPIFIHDASTGRIMDVNQAMVTAYGYTREEIMSLTVGELSAGVPPYDDAHALKKVRAAIENGSAVFEWVAKKKDGELVWVEVALTRAEVGGEQRVVAAVRDITERKTTEKAFRLDEARLEALLKLNQMTEAGIEDITHFSLEEAIRLTRSRVGYLAFTNEDETRMTMYAWSGQAMAECRIHDKQIEYDMAHSGLMGEAVRQRKPVVTNDYQAANPLKKGYPTGHVPIRRHMNIPVFDGDRIVAVAGVGNKSRPYDNADVRQLTLLMQGMWRLVQRKKSGGEKERLDQRIRQAYKMEAIGTLAGGIAHDFNNILAALLGYTELSLMETAPGSSLHSHMQKVLDAGKRARDLVAQILTFSRQSEQELLPVQIQLVVKEAAKFIRASLPASIEIRLKIIDDPTVMADATQFHQVLMNLCTNAGHAMRDTGGVLEIRLEELDLDADVTDHHPGTQPGRHMQLTVSDTGPGIPATLADRIFDPFFTTKTKGEGTGMGLAVTHGIVKNHGGSIHVSSGQDKGAVFSVLLPSVTPRTALEKPHEKTLARGTERILFVDDEEPIVELGINMLEGLGYQVTGMASSEKALSVFKASPDQFDLVVTDMTMPKISGIQLADGLLKIRPDIPIIMCTGFSRSVDEEKALELGICALIYKPILRHQISETVRKALDQ